MKKNTSNRVIFILFILSALIMAGLAIYVTFMINAGTAFLREDIRYRLHADARSAAEIVRAEELAQLTTPEDEESALYQELKERLIQFAQEEAIVFVYYYRLTDDGLLQPIIDNDTSENTYSLASEPIASEPDLLAALAGQITVTTLGDYSEGWDGLLSAYSPVYDDAGNIIAVAGVDINDEQILAINQQTRILSLFLLAGVIIVLATGILNLILQARRQRALRYQLEQQELMSSLARSLIAADKLEAAINQSLEKVGVFLKADRILISTSDENRDVEDSTPLYHWCADECFRSKPLQGDFDGLIQTTFPSTITDNSTVSALYCNNIQTEFNGKYRILAQAGIKSFIWMPIYADKTLWGVLSVEELGTKRRWSENEAQLVGLMGSSISGAVMRNQIDRERRIALDHAIEASEAKGDFLSNMSHEMRTPMNAIIGMTTIGRRAADIERKNYCLDKINAAGTHLLGIVNDVLDMSKIEAGKLELNEVPFYFRTMIQQVLTVTTYRIAEKGQTLDFDLDERIPAVLIGDDQRLAQVVMNLLSNANKFTPSEGRISVKVQILNQLDQTGGVCPIRFEVRDTGIGISAEQKPHLFTSFEQAETGIARKFGGTGLGLAISKRIVNMMGGDILVESELNKGSTFSFIVRLRKGDECMMAQEHDGEYEDRSSLAALSLQNAIAASTPGSEQVSQDESDASGSLQTVEKFDDFSGKHALLAEDMEVNREIVIALLEPTSLEIDNAENGIQAVELFAANPSRYDIIFMDLQMPEMDGLEATRRIRALDIPEAKTVPIIAMTANVFREDVERALNNGMNGHLGKPIDLEQLFATLHTYLNPTESD
ncbi:MAG: response regulator [Coriobacteriales bacterium]|jgi:signal transduction histidine kinase/CheY-like chemotaxis protein|nr:response regulator [Coriobacteriales bacterium]